MRHTFPAGGVSQNHKSKTSTMNILKIEKRVRRGIFVAVITACFTLAVALVGVQAGRNRAMSHVAQIPTWGPLAALAVVLLLGGYYWKKLRDEERAANKAQILVLFVVSMSVLVAVAALAVDAGFMFYSKATLQNAADAGSLAAIHTMVDLRGEEDDEEDVRETAQEEAAAIAALNHPGARYEVKFGVMEDGEFSECDEDTEATAVKVIVHRDAEAPDGALETLFASLAGVDSVDLTASASSASSSQITGSLPAANLRPFAVSEDKVANWEPGQSVSIQLPKPGGGNGNGKGKGKGKGGSGGSQSGAITPGNWGWLDLNGGANGASEQKEWIRNGYDGAIQLDQTGTDGRLCTYIEGTPGVRRALNHEFRQICGQDITLCVYDGVRGADGHKPAGANTEFRIVGFLSMNFQNIVPGERGSDVLLGTFNEIQSVHNFSIGEGGSPHSNLRRVCIMQ